jgi:hypothetical protein
VLIAVVAGAAVFAVAGCSTAVRGQASPAAATGATARPTTPSSHPSIPSGAQPSCLVADGCDDTTPTTTNAGVLCAPLPSAMSSFDAAARRILGGGAVGEPTTGAQEGTLGHLVSAVVDACGYQVMIDVANQYPNPLYGWLAATAVSALGEISELPEGLRCADLRGLGFGPKQAVDYYFLWGGPALMDADSDGIPCETVWSDVARYMPSNY